MKETICAVVVNDLNQILCYTVQGTKHSCEEAALERWGEKTWNVLKQKGARVVAARLTLLED